MASDLHNAGHEVLVIESNRDIVDRMRPTLDVEWLAADACEVSTLDAAGLAETDVVVAATGDDEDNLVIALLSKQEFAVPRVVARVNHPKNHWMFDQSWGVDVAVSTPHLLSAIVEEAVSVGSLVRLLQLDSSGARLVEVTLAQSSPAAGQRIADLHIPRDATVVAIARDSHVVVPRGDTLLEEGDEVLVLVTPESEEAVRAALVGAAHRLTQPPPALAQREAAPGPSLMPKAGEITPS